MKQQVWRRDANSKVDNLLLPSRWGRQCKSGWRLKNSYYTTGQPSRDGIGKFYMGREISHVMGHLGAGWLERPERERQERTDLLIAGLSLSEDSVVADIGAGTVTLHFLSHSG